MKKDRARVMFILSSILLLIIVMVFTGGLNIVSFEKNFTNSMVSGMAVSGGETVRKIEYAVKYGKPLDNFYGMQALLKSKKEDFGEVEAIDVVAMDGTILYSTSAAEGRKLPQSLMGRLDLGALDSDTKYLFDRDEDYNHTLMPIRDNNNRVIGLLDIVFNKSIIALHIIGYIQTLILELFIVGCLGALVLILLFNRIVFIDNGGQVRRNLLIITLIAVIGISQAAFGFLNYRLFDKAYIEMANKNAVFVADVLKKDIESVIKKGVSYDRLYQIEDYLSEILKAAPDLDKIYISNEKDEVIYTTNVNAKRQESDGKNKLVIRTELLQAQGGKTYSIGVEISEKRIRTEMRAILLDMATVLATSFFFMIELTLFLIAILKQKAAQSAILSSEAMSHRDNAIVRGLTFIIFIALFMPTAFVPVMMEKLGGSVFGLPQSLVLGLPVSLNFLAGAVAILFAGYIIDSKGWKFTFLAGCLLLGIGALISITAADGLVFILSRVISGLGYGLSLMAMRGFAGSNKENKSESFAGLNAGLNSGINCGVVIGAILADRVGYKHVFLASLFVLALAAAFASVFTRQERHEAIAKGNAKKPSKGSMKDFIKNPSVFGLLILIVIPTAICGVFLSYFFPLYAKSIGESSSSVSRAYLLNGVCVIALSSFASKFTSKHFGNKKSIVIAGVIVAAAIFTFALHGSIITAFMVAIALGIAESFGATAQDTYILSLKASGEVGEGKALAYISNSKKIGQTLGPMVFGVVAAFGTKGVGLIGGFYLIFIIGFYFLSSNDLQRIGKEGTYVQY